jgi:hypothetical protein
VIAKYLLSAGECLRVEYRSGSPVDKIAGGFLAEAHDDEASAQMPASVQLVLEAGSRPFQLRAADRVTRGVWSDGSAVVIEDACTSGFDLRCEPQGQLLSLSARWRPPARTRLAATLLRQRAALLGRAALLQYPLMWWASTRGRAPLHVSALQMAGAAPMLAGPSGVGKSTLVDAELTGEAPGVRARATCDNLAVSDGRSVFGVVEPRRTATGNGRRASHGRRESAFVDRLPCVTPDRVIAVSLSESAAEAHLQPLSAESARRVLVTGTYMAGELRRYWPFAAALTAATGLGPSAAPVAAVARQLTGALPCFSLTLSRSMPTRLSWQLLPSGEASPQRGNPSGQIDFEPVRDKVISDGERGRLEP